MEVVIFINQQNYFVCAGDIFDMLLHVRPMSWLIIWGGML